MVTAIFATSTVVCALGWLSRYISTVSLLYYLVYVDKIIDKTG